MNERSCKRTNFCTPLLYPEDQTQLSLVCSPQFVGLHEDMQLMLLLRLHMPLSFKSRCRPQSLRHEQPRAPTQRTPIDIVMGERALVLM